MAALTWTPIDVVGIDPAEVGRDEGAEVTALGAVALVPEAGHQLGERAGDPPGCQPGSVTGRRTRSRAVTG